jgi:hypothetical protein
MPFSSPFSCLVSAPTPRVSHQSLRTYRTLPISLSLSLSLLVFVATFFSCDATVTQPFSSRSSRTHGCSTTTTTTTTTSTSTSTAMTPAKFGMRMWGKGRHFTSTSTCSSRHQKGLVSSSNSRLLNRLLFHDEASIRGGSTEVDNDGGEHDAKSDDAAMMEVDTSAAKDENEDDNKGDKDEQEEEAEVESPMINHRIALSIQTNWGSPILDQSLELEATRNKNIAAIKERVAKQLPGKPPALALQFVYGGRVLDDDILLDELFDDEDDDSDVDGNDVDADDESSLSSKTLILNVVPPVDPHFAAELSYMISPHSEDDNRTLTTDDLLTSYFLNQVAMTRNSELLANPDAASSASRSSSLSSLSSPLMRLQMRQQAEQLKEQLQQETDVEIWKKALEPVPKHTEEYRGNRYRSGRGGATTNLRRTLQTNFNVVRLIEFSNCCYG